MLMIVVLSGLVVSSVSATGVVPAISELEGMPGETAVTEIYVINDSDQDKTFYLSTLKFTAAGESGVPQFIPYSEDRSGFPEWISFSTTVLELAPGENAAAQISVAIPTDAKAGGHYAAVVVNDSPVNTEGVVVHSQVASLLLLDVTGQRTESAAILDFNVSKFNNRLPIEFEYRIQNQGDVHVTPSGTITVENVAGSEAAQVSVNSGGGRILPLSTRQYMDSWSRIVDLQTGKGFVEEIRNEWENFGLGRYTAELEIQYSDEQGLITATTTFWIIPWHLIIVAVTVTILMLLISRIKINLKKNV